LIFGYQAVVPEILALDRGEYPSFAAATE